MNIFTSFFSTFVKSLTSPKYYAEVLASKVGASVGYFFILTLIVSAIIIGKIAIPLSMFNPENTATEITKLYPSDLVVALKDGKLAVNKPLPYVIAMPKGDKNTSTSPVNAIVFESDAHIKSPTQFSSYDTAILVTETSIYTQQSSSGEIKIYPIPKETKDFVLDRKVISDAKDRFLATPVIKQKLYVPVILIGLFIAFIPFAFIFRLLTAFFYAIAATFFAGLLKQQALHGKSISFGKIWQVSLHTLTLPIVLAMITGFFSDRAAVSGWLYFGIYLAFTLYVLSKSTENSEVVQVLQPVKSVKSKKSSK